VSARARRSLTISLLVALAATLAPAAATARPTPKGFFGVVSQEPLRAKDFANMADGRVGSVRVAMNWASVQQVDGLCQADVQVGICSWTLTDYLVGRAADAGVTVLPILAGPPSFVSENPRHPPIEGYDAARWRAFVAAAAARYGPGGYYWERYSVYGAKPRPITEWQVWNEQNGKLGWEGRPNARKYARLLEISATAIRGAQPEARIALGGMFGDAVVPFSEYMRRLYRVKGVERWFDTISLHPYAPQLADLRNQLENARRIARRAGDRDAMLRVTEIGWSSANGGHRLMRGAKGQARMVKRSFRLFKQKRARYNLTGVNYFALQDTKNKSTCRFCLRSGLFKLNGKPKPAWRAFKVFSK
jgi:hypothetical protein